jgi:hypothetical protein
MEAVQALPDWFATPMPTMPQWIATSRNEVFVGYKNAFMEHESIVDRFAKELVERFRAMRKAGFEVWYEMQLNANRGSGLPPPPRPFSRLALFHRIHNGNLELVWKEVTPFIHPTSGKRVTKFKTIKPNGADGGYKGNILASYAHQADKLLCQRFEHVAQQIRDEWATLRRMRALANHLANLHAPAGVDRRKHRPFVSASTKSAVANAVDAQTDRYDQHALVLAE